jgi:riboflavin kinase/FMN adenylyltransferase
MVVSYGFDSLPADMCAVITVGSFDGVHSGHRALLDALVAMSRRKCAESVVVTFEPHPRIAMGRAEGMKLLTTVEERALLLARYGVERVIVAHFDDSFRSQTYEEFVRMLVAKCGMVGMVVGYNHRLGRGNEGNYDNLQPLGQELGFALERVEQYTDSGDKVSSTVLRGLLERGEAERAHEIMGHPYIIMGKVCDGVLRVEDEYKLLPCDGKYSALVDGQSSTIKVCGRELQVESRDGDITIEL